MRSKIIIVSVALLMIAIAFVFLLYPQYRLSKRYDNAVDLYTSGNYIEAISGFRDLNSYKDATEWIKKCELSLAEQYVNENKFDEAIKIYETYQLQDDINRVLYKKASNLMAIEDYEKAIEVFVGIRDYDDVEEQVKECNYCIAELFYKEKNYSKSMKIFQELGDYKKASDYFNWRDM